MAAQPFMPVHHGLSQVHLNRDNGPSRLDRWRARDVMLFWPGNVGVPALGVMGSILWWRARRRRLAALGDDLFMLSLVLAAVSYLTLVIVFMAPVILPVWPQGAVTGAALGGGVLMQRYWPGAFAVAFLLTVTYTVVVWGLAPLRLAIAFDPFGGAMLTSLVLLIGRYHQHLEKLVGEQSLPV
jgi:hypothetical protein